MGTGHWSRRCTTLGILLLLAATLSACIESRTDTTIAPNLGGTSTMRVGFSKDALQLFASIGTTPGTGGMPAPAPPDPFADLATQVTALGGTSRPYDEGGFVGLDIVFGFSSLDELQKQWNTVLGISGGAGSGGLIQLTAKKTESGGVRIEAAVDPLSDLNDPATTNSLMLPPELRLLAKSSGGIVAFSFTFPGDIRDSDSLASISGTTASWSFNLGDKKATIYADSAKG